MAMNIPKMTEAEVRRRGAEAKVLLGFACEIYKYQLANHQHFLHEHPAGAALWAQDVVAKLLEDPRVGSVVGTSASTASGHGPMMARSSRSSRPRAG